MLLRSFKVHLWNYPGLFSMHKMQVIPFRNSSVESHLRCSVRLDILSL
jgi:hypothetical protein